MPLTYDDLPPPMAALRRDSVGRPVPWFVAWLGDPPAPDFRVVRRDGIMTALRGRLCWVCGTRRPIDRHAAFVIGPMRSINRTTGEPPSHLECARWSVKHCPFLSHPSMARRDRGLPEERHSAGIMVTRNPGVAAVWLTDTWNPFSAPVMGILFNVGRPSSVEWWHEGRPATHAEVMAGLDGGMKILREACESASDRRVLEREYTRALGFVPPPETTP